MPNTFPMKKHLKSRNPTLNIPRRHEPVATDTVFSDTPVRDLDLAMRFPIFEWQQDEKPLD